MDAASTCIFNTCTVNSINEHNYILGKTVTSTCRTSQECYGKLVCVKGNCQCSEQLYWDGTNCIISKLCKHFKTITACIYSFLQETQGYRNNHVCYYTDNRNILRYSNEINKVFHCLTSQYSGFLHQ